MEAALAAGCFAGFFDAMTEGQGQQELWQFYLHKIQEESWGDFKARAKTLAGNRQLAQDGTAAARIVAVSRAIVAGFTPPDRKEAKDGTI